MPIRDPRNLAHKLSEALGKRHAIVRKFYSDGKVQEIDLGYVTAEQASDATTSSIGQDERIIAMRLTDEQGGNVIVMNLKMQRLSEYIMESLHLTIENMVNGLGEDKSPLTGEAYSAKCESCPARDVCFPNHHATNTLPLLKPRGLLN